MLRGKRVPCNNAASKLQSSDRFAQKTGSDGVFTQPGSSIRVQRPSEQGLKYAGKPTLMPERRLASQMRFVRADASARDATREGMLVFPRQLDCLADILPVGVLLGDVAVAELPEVEARVGVWRGSIIRRISYLPCTCLRIPTYPVSRSDDIRSVIPEHPVTFGSTPLRLVS